MDIVFFYSLEMEWKEGPESVTFSYSLNVNFKNPSNMSENLVPQHTRFLVSLFQADAQGFCRISYDTSVKQA